MFDNNRILVVDDNDLIHEDFKKILFNTESIQEINDYINLEKELFGSSNSSTLTMTSIEYEIDFAFQGQEAFEMVKAAEKKGKPYALIFMDVRMPPGWDGIETIAKVWDKFPNIEIVICSAYSDYSWDKIITKLGTNDHLIFLKKPFDSIEVKQLALALVKKWNLYEKSKNYVDDLEKDVSKRTKQLKSMVQDLVENRDKLKQEIFVRKLTEQKLALEKENLSFILKNVPDAVISTDNNGKITLVNKATEMLLGIQNQYLINCSVKDILDLSDKEGNKFIVYSEKDIEGGELESCNDIVLELNVSENIKKSVILSCSHIIDKTGKVSGMVTLIKDISEKIKLEEELLKAKNLDSVSTFAGGIAQDFEKIVSNIIGNITLSKKTMNIDDKAIQYLKKAEDELMKAEMLSQQLKTFSKETEANLSLIDMANSDKEKSNKKILVLSKDVYISNILKKVSDKLKCFFNTDLESTLSSDIVLFDESYIIDPIDYESIKTLINPLNVKSVLLTSHNKSYAEEKYKDLKFSDILEKPFRISDIKNLL